jgi:transcriptional regulator with XRE-family HTH domain
MCETHTKSVCVMPYTFSETMRRQMEAKKLGPREVAAKVGKSFEHIRKLISSETFPSRSLQNALADLLEIDRSEFEKQVNADRWREKYGKIPTIAQARHPIAAVWEDLTDDQQTVLLCMARCMVKQTKRKAA